MTQQKQGRFCRTRPAAGRVTASPCCEQVDLQKVGPAADRCVFSGLAAGSLYRLQVVSWSRGMSSDTSVLARTGQSSTELTSSSSPPLPTHLLSVVFPIIPGCSPGCGGVSAGSELRTDQQTDGQLAARRGKLEQLRGKNTDRNIEETLDPPVLVLLEQNCNLITAFSCNK